eukprot:TRINITY_DN44912_c0_g1_i1.p1 TRINITY_DN44912_c0_g1~~TRINITY_DN44912_c0_g1_i1.p1  ORF type:complete len:845 (+),score=204.70 TRINITY_DN44912_c0_g1_i1:75-2537(+)
MGGCCGCCESGEGDVCGPHEPAAAASGEPYEDAALVDTENTESISVRWHSPDGETWQWGGCVFLCIEVCSGALSWQVWQCWQGFYSLAQRLPAQCPPLPSKWTDHYDVCGQLTQWLGELLSNRSLGARGKVSAFLAFPNVAFDYGGGGFRMPDPRQAQAVEQEDRPIFWYRYHDDDEECGLTDSERSPESSDASDSASSSSDSSGSDTGSSAPASDGGADRDSQARMASHSIDCARARWPLEPGPRVVLPRRLRGCAAYLEEAEAAHDAWLALQRCKLDLEGEEGRVRGIFDRREARLREAMTLRAREGLLEVGALAGAAQLAAEAREGLRRVGDQMRQEKEALLRDAMFAAMRSMNRQAEECKVAYSAKVHGESHRTALLGAIESFTKAGTEWADSRAVPNVLELGIESDGETIAALVVSYLAHRDRGALAATWSGGREVVREAEWEVKQREWDKQEAMLLSVVRSAAGEQYSVRGELACGTFGRVYAAAASDGQPVVLKVLRGGWAPEREALTELAAAGCRHFNLLQLHGEVRLSAETAALIFARYDGDLESIRPCGAPELRSVAVQLVHALEWLHARGWAHTDLKPPNILLSGLGGGTRHAGRWRSAARVTAVVSDLGCAWRLRAAQDHLIATPGYRAPEVSAGRHWGPGVDIYALGVVLLETFTGTAQGALSRLRLEAAVRAAADSFAWGSGFMATVVDGMLRADPDRRPSARRLLSAPRHRDLFGAERGLLAHDLGAAAAAATEQVWQGDLWTVVTAGAYVRPERYEAAPGREQGPAGKLRAAVRLLHRRAADLQSALQAAADVGRRAQEEAHAR